MLGAVVRETTQRYEWVRQLSEMWETLLRGTHYVPNEAISIGIA